MPFIQLNVWPVKSAEQKAKWIKEVTSMTIDLLNIPPDKIQVLVQEVTKENWGKAGAVPTQPDFAEKSRLVSSETQESYHHKQADVENMAVITVDVWDMYTQVQKNEWTKRFTKITLEIFDIPADKILVLLRDMPPGNWGQAGYTGADSDFLNKSRNVGKTIV